MKRLILFLLVVLLLLLNGCTPEPLSETTETTVATEPKPAELYLPDSTMEQQTGGAVRVYPLKDDAYYGLGSIGIHLLVAGENTLLVLSGERCEQIVTQTTGNTRIASLAAEPTGVGYYRPESREVVICNPLLQTTAQLTLPEDIVGTPVISLARNEVYYCIKSEIRALSIVTGISRLIRQRTAENQILMDSYFDGTLLACRILDENGKSNTEYISSETGQILSSGEGLLALRTFGESYFAQRQDGSQIQGIFGIRDEEGKSFPLTVTSNNRTGWKPVLETSGIVGYADKEGDLELSYYDLQSGKRTSQVVLPGVDVPAAIHCDGTYIWILAADKKSSQQTLYRWDISLSVVEDDTIYTGPLYTASNPDTYGLELCREQADAIEKNFGVKLAIWKAAEKNTGDYTLVAEHRPEIITKTLKDLEAVLARFPEGFLQETMAGREIQISLVKSISGGLQWAQFWGKEDYHVLISTHADAEHAVLQGLAYGVDSHVLGNSRDFDTWNQLNPEGFVYANSYDVPAQPDYLEGEQRAFADIRAMSYPHEDRCRVFYHAMLKDNAEVFASDIMQAKLLRLCMGIREAYGWEKSSEEYLWEQYLAEPIVSAEK